MLLAAGVEALRLAVWPAGSWQKAYMAGVRGPEGSGGSEAGETGGAPHRGCRVI